MTQPLPSKEQSLFRHVVQAYESKQYKKGLKAAEQVLKKFPNHGDTLAMKALILNSQAKSEEAFELAKLALKNDMKSHVTWHVYGLLWRSAKNYEEAIKAYKFALRLDPNSVQIQRDLAMLQAQMRDYAGYTQSRKAMLQARPSLRQNWTALAVAHHLEKDYEAAENILTMYEETLKTAPPRSDHEHAGAVMFKNTIIAESGDHERALEHLLSIYKDHPDRTAAMERKANYLLTLKRLPEAEKAYRALLKRNSDHREYYYGLEKALALDRNDPNSHDKLVALYTSYAKSSARGSLAQRLPLDFTTGDRFRSVADMYLRHMLHKGVPSTFATVKALYIDDEKLRIIQELVQGYATEDGQTNGDDSNEAANAWRLAVHYFLAQHYNYRLSRDLTEAMKHIEEAIKLSERPTEYTYVMTKARILKHLGSIHEAAQVMNKARQMDLKDRYIATKCAKYQLRNNEPDKAIKTMGLFTREKATNGPLGDLIDMQCVWYLHEDAMAQRRIGKDHLALKRLHSCFNMFETYQEDQFDFHSFSLRKGPINVYIDMLRWEDELRRHPLYARVALSAIKVYTDMYDKSQQVDGEVNGKTDNAAERKKAAKKARKDAEKALEEQKAAIAAKPVLGPDGEVTKPDEDPQGFKLAQTSDPLGEATKFLTPLLELAPDRIESQLAGFEVMIRKKKYLPALKCLLAAQKLDAENPLLHRQIVDFQLAMKAITEPLPASVSDVLKSLSVALPPTGTLSDFNNTFARAHAQSAAHAFAVAEVRHRLDPGARSAVSSAVTDTLGLEGLSLEDATEGLEVVRRLGAEDDVRTYREHAKRKFDRADVFAQ